MEKRKVVKCKVVLECKVDVCPEYFNDSLEDAIFEALSCDLYDYVVKQKIETLETYYEDEDD
jgi:hypothetical protein